MPLGTTKPAPASHVTQVMDHPSKVYAARLQSPATLIIANATVTVKLSITTENVSSVTKITSSTPIKNASPVSLRRQSLSRGQSTNPSKNQLKNLSLPLTALNTLMPMSKANITANGSTAANKSASNVFQVITSTRAFASCSPKTAKPLTPKADALNAVRDMKSVKENVCQLLRLQKRMITAPSMDM